jgi:hypothetical protein
MVMAGGLLSAVIVGAILEKGDLYANLAAESYVQSADHADFWKNMSEEEKKKAEKMLAKIKEAKDGGITNAEELKKSVLAAIEREEGQQQQATSTSSLSLDQASNAKEATSAAAAKAPNDIFSDYGD